MTSDDEHLALKATRSTALERLDEATRSVRNAEIALRQFEASRDADAARLTDKYRDGYLTGQTWTKNHRPGGPFVYQGADEKMRIESKTEHRHWMQGFNEGLAARRSR